MSTIELKEKLLKKLESIDDSILKDILALIEFETTKEIHLTTDEEKTSIQQGLDDLNNDKSFTGEDVKKEIDQWLKK